MQLYHRAAELLWSRSLKYFLPPVLCPTHPACLFYIMVAYYLPHQNRLCITVDPFRLPVSALLSLQFLICAVAFCVLLVSPNRNVGRCMDAGWRRDRRRVAPLVRAESLCFSHLVWLVWFCLGSLEVVCLLYYLLPRRLSCVSEFQSPS